MMNPPSTYEFIIILLVAMVAGICVGLEREMKNKNAGLKTNALVAVGAAIFVSISFHFIGIANVDAGRILSQVIVGVGFLGAGVIIQRHDHVRGLATAASIWCSAALGCLAALRMYMELAVAVGLIVAINLVLGYLAHLRKRKMNGNGKEEE